MDPSWAPSEGGEGELASAVDADATKAAADRRSGGGRAGGRAGALTFE